MFLELSFLVTLILLNGVFAMSEIAIVSSRRARLAQMAQHGSAGAVHALTLSNDLTRFLSSVQVGITSIGEGTGFTGPAPAQGSEVVGRHLEPGEIIKPGWLA